MKIVITNEQNLSNAQRARLEALGDVTYYEAYPSPEEYLERVAGADIICSGTAGIKDVYTQLSNVYVTFNFVNLSFLDLDLMRSNGVAVSNAPGINRHAVSEWIVAMILELARSFTSYTGSREEYRKDGAIPPNHPGLTRATLAILGAGNISKQLAQIAEALDMNVRMFARGDDLARTLDGADYIVNTLSVTEQSLGMIDDDFFTSVTPGAHYISVADGKTEDQDAIIRALDAGVLAGAATDCGGILVGDTADPLYVRYREHPKVIVTPHIAYNSEHSFVLGNDVMIDNVEAWINGTPQNVLNAS